MNLELTFMGATETVTGSKFLITCNTKNYLVDCGLFQGYKELRLRNWDKLPIDPAKIDAVILTHAHIDHSGYLPLLIKNGFKGKIYSTPGTKALCSILLPDSGHLQEEDAKRANRYSYSKHKPALPLYTEEEGRRTLRYFETVDFNEEHHLGSDLTFHFSHSEHIIGSAFVYIRHGSKTICFTGDMGRPHDPIMVSPADPEELDYLIVESSYGDRLHDKTDPQIAIADIVNRTVKNKGSIIIPAFAVGRAQSLLYYIYQLKNAKKIPDIPVFLDSPMAISATNQFCDFTNEHWLSKHECKLVCDAATYVHTPEESFRISNLPMSKIIISASGMAEGGRILHHLKKFLPDPKSTILFTGFQAGGTRGARIINGEQEIKIHGEYFPVHAKIELISSTSAHADYQEILDWLSKVKKQPKTVFITHGEPESALSLKNKIEAKFGWTCKIPKYLQCEKLD